MKKILIADDSLFMRSSLKVLLSSKYEIIEAANGKEAVEKYQKEKPDLALLDIVMPKGENEGVNVLAKIMRINPDAIVIMVTAMNQEMLIEQCVQLGASDYILKPIDEALFLKTVGKYLK